MPLAEFPGFCDGMYLETSPLFDSSRSQNLFPVPGAPSSKSKMALYGRPGLSQINFACTIASPARALWAGDNRLFAVGGTHFYELSSTGTILHDYGAMAGSSGSGPCQIVGNGTQLLVMDSGGGLYVANAVAYTMDIPQVVDSGGASLGNMSAVALEYIDGFFVAIASDATATLVGGAGSTPNLLMVSNSMDGTKWQAVNYAFRRGAPDRCTNLAALNGQLWIFGQKNIEIWYNAGNPLFPFARYQGATINLGLLWPYTVVKFENTILWAGADDRGYVKIYKAAGMQPQRVSTFAVEQLIGADFINQPVSAFGYQENGHTFYVMILQAPGTFLVYDLTTGLWHERYYGTSWPVCAASVPGWGSPLYGPVFVGDGNSGKVMRQAMIYPSDLGANIGYVRTAPLLTDTDKWMKHSRFQLVGNLGSAQPVLDYSNDGGAHYCTPKAAQPPSNEQGTPSTSPSLGRYNWNQLGRFRHRTCRVTISSNSDLIRITNANIRVNAGTES